MKFEMTKTKAWGLLAVVMVAVVIAGGWFFALTPQKNKVSTLQAQTAQQQQANLQLSDKIARLKKMNSDGDKVAALKSISQIDAWIPSTPELTSYVRTLAKLAMAHQVVLISIAPSEPVPVRAAAAAGSQSAPAAPSTLSSIQMSLAVNGSYDQVEGFLADLQSTDKTSRTTIVSSINLTPGQQPKPAGQPLATGAAAQQPWETLQANVTLAVFMAAAPQVGASPGGASAGAGGATPASPAASPAPTASSAGTAS